jgi:hypothetical protein
MDLIKDMKALVRQRKVSESTRAQLRKRSKDSLARPKAKKNIFTNDPRMQGI